MPNRLPLPPTTVVPIIWAALISATLFYGVLILSVPADTAPFDPALGRILTVVAVIQFIATFVLRHFLCRKAPLEPQTDLRNRIILFALSEGIAIYGLVIHFLGGEKSLSLQFIVLGLLALALLAPVGFLRQFKKPR